MSLGSVLQFALLLSTICGGLAYSLKDEIKEHGIAPKIEVQKIEKTAKEYSGYNKYEAISNAMSEKQITDDKVTYVKLTYANAPQEK